MSAALATLRRRHHAPPGRPFRRQFPNRPNRRHRGHVGQRRAGRTGAARHCRVVVITA